MKRLDKFEKAVVELLNEKKAEDIQVVDVSDITPFADVYIIASAMNERHLNALKNDVVDQLEKLGATIKHVEGKESTGWIIVDASHFVIHLFTKPVRDHFKLEEFIKGQTKK